MMKTTAILFTLSCSLFACADSVDATPDAMPPEVPIALGGRFDMHSAFAIAEPPVAAREVLAMLDAATDGPDDPSRYVIDRLVETLPEGYTKSIATELAPWVAAYVNERIAIVAPRFVTGVRELADGLERISVRFGTVEHIAMSGPSAELDGRSSNGEGVSRTIVGARFDDVDVPFAPFGAADIGTRTTATLDDDRMAFAKHQLVWPYGVALRLGFERVVIPRVVPGAHDVVGALRGLFDCKMLGVLVAERIGWGSPTTYEHACDVALIAVAVELDERLAVFDPITISVEAAGAARVVDDDGDGSIDVIVDGYWKGTADGVGLGYSTFAGSAR